jgi:hypothetical protein
MIFSRTKTQPDLLLILLNRFKVQIHLTIVVYGGSGFISSSREAAMEIDSCKKLMSDPIRSCVLASILIEKINCCAGS